MDHTIPYQVSGLDMKFCGLAIKRFQFILTPVLNSYINFKILDSPYPTCHQHIEYLIHQDVWLSRQVLIKEDSKDSQGPYAKGLTEVNIEGAFTSPVGTLWVSEEPPAGHYGRIVPSFSDALQARYMLSLCYSQSNSTHERNFVQKMLRNSTHYHYHYVVHV